MMRPDAKVEKIYLYPKPVDFRKSIDGLAALARAAMVLADVLKRADQRAGDLAEVADQARARGMTCEQAYEGIAK